MNQLPPPQPQNSRTTRILGLLSVIVGVIGTYLTIRSETNHENSLSGRALYGFTLALAGILIEATRSSQPTISTVNSSIKVKVTELSTKHQSVSIPNLSESAIEITDLKLPHVENSKIDKGLSSQSISPLTISPRQRLISGLQWSWNILPSAWFSQAFYLMIRNAIQESADQTVEPSLSALPLLYWIENNRNELSVVEYAILRFLPTAYNFRPLFYGITASFWSGYNLTSTIKIILNKFFAPKRKNIDAKSSTVIPIATPTVSFNTLNVFSKIITGLVLMSGSIILLKSVPEASNWRDLFAQILGSLGGYLLTYPLGQYLGYKIPQRYHNYAISLCMYLLVPCAAPGLSIIHYLLLTIGGLCGGIVHHILSSRYYYDLQIMQERLSIIQLIMADMPPWVKLLRTFPLPEEKLLLNHRKKNLILKRVIDLVLIGLTIIGVVNLSISLTRNDNRCSHKNLGSVLKSKSDAKELAENSALTPVHCQKCHQDIFSIQIHFHSTDRLFTTRQFDVSFDSQVADSTLRGYAVANQFQFNLPETLKLAETNARFYF